MEATKTLTQSQWENLAQRISPSKVFYGTSDTAATTQVKNITCPSFRQADIVVGACLVVSMDNAQDYDGQVKINVNNTGEQVFAPKQDEINGKGAWAAKSTVMLTYDGLAWCLIGTNLGGSDGGGVPTFAVSSTTTPIQLPAEASLATATIFLLYFPQGAVLYASDDYEVTDGTTTLSLTLSSYGHSMPRQTVSIRAEDTIMCTVAKEGTTRKVYLHVPTYTDIPRYGVRAQNSYNAQLYAFENGVPLPNLGMIINHHCYVIPETDMSYGQGIMLGLEVGGAMHQYQMCYMTDAGLKPITVLKKGLPYEGTIVEYLNTTSTGATNAEDVFLVNYTEQGATPSWRNAFTTKDAPTSTSTHYALSVGTPDGVSGWNVWALTRVHIAFTWTGSSAVDVSVYPQNSEGGTKYSEDGTEVYTNGTTRGAVARSNWPMGGKVTGIKKYDTVSLTFEMHAASLNDPDWGEASGCITKASFFKNGTSFYEGTFYSKASNTFGGLIEGISLDFSTTPSVDNFMLKAEYYPYIKTS